MAFKISKNNLYKIIFTLCVLVPYFNNYELTFGVWSLTTIFTIRKKYSKNISIQIACFSIIFIVAFLSSFFSDYKNYDFIRDITYLIKPILGLLIGYQLCKNYLINPLKTIISAGTLLSIVHLLIVIYSFLIIGVRTIIDLRLYCGYFSDFEIYALILLIFSNQLKIDLKTKTKNTCILLLASSSMFYLSRTNFIQFIILFIALKGYLVLNKRTIYILTTFIIMGVIGYSSILYYNPKRDGAGIEAFLYKIKNAPIEPFKTKINKDDYKDFNDNYRSVENILTVKESSNIGYQKTFFGQGLGSTLDLQREVELDGILLRHISIMHNGFMTVFLKSGLIGVLILLLSIFTLKKNYSIEEQNRHLNFLITGTIVFLIVSYWVFMGLYFKADTKSIVIGLLIGLVEKNKIKSIQ